MPPKQKGGGGGSKAVFDLSGTRKQGLPTGLGDGTPELGVGGKKTFELDVDGTNKNTDVEPEGASTTKQNIFQRNPGKTAAGLFGLALIAEGIISSEKESKCLDECLPSNYNLSEESGLGTLSREEMIYQTANNPHCNENSTDCFEFCAAECDIDSWAEIAGKTAGSAAGAGAKAVGETAGAATKGVFEGLGLGPILIGVIVMIVLIVLVTML